MAVFFTNEGKDVCAARLIGATPSQPEPKFIAWGTGAGAAAATSVSLSTESTEEARVTGTATQVTTTQTNDTYQVVGTLTCTTSGKTITNAGVFDIAAAIGATRPVAGDKLLLLGDSLSTVLAVGESIQFTCKLQYT